MYYNIKIKSKGSEFSLDCANKEITQREMDIYFAYIYGADEEFKSKIKKIQINYDAIETVNELEDIRKNVIEKEDTLTLQTPDTVFENNPSNQIPVSEVSFSEIPEIEPESVIQTYNTPDISNQAVSETPPSITIVPSTQNTISTQNVSFVSVPESQSTQSIQTISFVQKEPEIEAVKTVQFSSIPSLQDNSIVETKPFESEKTMTVSNIIQTPDIFTGEQKEETFDFEQKKSSELSFVSETPVAFEYQEDNSNINPSPETISYNNTPLSTEIIEKNQTIKINNEPAPKAMDDFINLVQNEINSFDISSDSNENLINVFTENAKISEDNSINHETNTIELEFGMKTEPSEVIDEEQKRKDAIQNEQNNQAILDDIFSSFNQTDNVSNPPPLTPNESSVIETPSQITEEIPQISPVVINQTPQDIPSQPEINVKKEAQLDFGLFLKGFVADETIDIFIICAYYIRHILKQNGFTMKFINSKLFQATGKIADMSIVEDLISKQLIRTFDLEENKLYTITQDGESYFVSKFQR